MKGSKKNMDATTPTGMQIVTNAMAAVVDVVSKVYDIMVANPVLLFCLAAGLIPVGIAIFAQLKSVAR